MKWIVGYTGINCETPAYRALKAKSIECYLPIGRKIVRHARRQEERLYPVFSRYLFVKTDICPENLALIRGADGIIDILTNNWEPMEVPAWTIDEIKQREIAGEFDIKPKFQIKPPNWSRGFAVLKQLLEPGSTVTV